MLSSEERVQNEDVNPPKCAHCLVGKLFGIGDVSQVSDAVAKNRDRAVRDRDRQHIDVPDAK